MVEHVPYIVFNLRSPDAGGAMGKLHVRQAIEYGVDKAAVVKAYGGPAVSTVINTVIPPGNIGYAELPTCTRTTAATGNVATCKSDLAKAGYPNGLKLIYMYPNDSSNTRAFTAIQASLASCGINVTAKGEPGSSFFVDLGNAPENNKAEHLGPRPGRLDPRLVRQQRPDGHPALFQGPNCVVNTVNYGCYNSATVNS